MKGQSRERWKMVISAAAGTARVSLVGMRCQSAPSKCQADQASRDLVEPGPARGRRRDVASTVGGWGPADPEESIDGAGIVLSAYSFRQVTIPSRGLGYRRSKMLGGRAAWLGSDTCGRCLGYIAAWATPRDAML